MSALRIGVVGARRVRQGLGPFVARDLAAAGAEVAAVLGTSAPSAERAARELATQIGVRPRAYADPDALLERERLDALAILSPPESHRGYLERALAAGLHVLCEKPLLWGGPAPARRAARLAADFDARGLVLWENCQWPYTLRAFAELHPGALDAPLHSFAMRLAPASRGPDMLRDSLSHPLSLLQALAPAPDARVEQVSLHAAAPLAEASQLGVGFAFVAGDTRVETRVDLARTEARPRPAAYAVNGRWAVRNVREVDYSMRLACGGREVELPDPLGALVRSFVAELERVREGGRPAGSAAIAQRMALLESLVSAGEERE